MSELLLIESQVRLNPLAPISVSELKVLLATILMVVDANDRRLEVKLVSDADMAHLHGQFLGIPGPTNVLSFPAESPEDGLGCLVVSVDTLTREADLYGQDLREHLVRLLTHGVLHLLGIDHGPVMDSLIQKALLAALTD
jgi:probable rRNA maturation factor